MNSSTTAGRRTRATLAGALAALTLTSACFAEGSQDTGEDPTEQRLQLALNFPPVAALSPYSDDAVLIARMGTAENLVVFDQEGIAQPALATDWEFLDPSTVELSLRPDVVFHDGTDMDAETVAQSLTYAVQATTPPLSVADRGLTFTAIDETTVQVRSPEADPLLVQRLGAPGMVVLSPAAYEEDPQAPDPVGTATGPYEIESVQGATSADLTAYPQYWAGAPALDGIDVRFVGDAGARTAGVQSDEFDVSQNIPIAQLSALTDDEVQSLPVPRVVGVYLNTTSGPLADPGLRAAARAAIDAEPVVSGVYEDEADPAEGLFLSSSAWTPDRPVPEYPEAIEVDGQQITLATYDDRPELPEAVSVVADQLRSVGFDVEVLVQEYGTLEAQMLAGEFDAVLGSRLYLGDTGDPVGYLATDFTCAGTFNPAQLCEPDIDAAVAATNDIIDPDERRAAALDIEAQILATDAFVPLLHERTRTAYAPSVTGLGEDPFERILITADTTLE